MQGHKVRNQFGLPWERLRHWFTRRNMLVVLVPASLIVGAWNQNTETDPVLKRDFEELQEQIRANNDTLLRVFKEGHNKQNKAIWELKKQVKGELPEVRK